MTIDVNLYRADEEFIDNIDEIIEESMGQIFILHPSSVLEINEIKELADEYESIFYSVPLHLRSEADSRCVAYSIKDERDIALLMGDKSIMIDESVLTESLIASLGEYRGIILNATQEYPSLPNFLLAIGTGNVGMFDIESLNKMSMDRIVLQSTYPEYGFEGITSAVKVISDAMLRPEQSIIARATKSSLELFGFRKS
jgi:hypothetical protein